MFSHPNTEPAFLKKLKLKKNTTEFKTNFSFLNQHNGFRRGKIHLLLGTPSGGKSTLRNSVLFDFLICNPDKKVFLWLSEETLNEFEIDLSENEIPKSCIDRLIVFSEQDNVNITQDITSKTEFLTESIIKSGCDLFIYDNITTSFLYGESFKEQTDFIHDFKRCFNACDVSCFILAHTSSAIKDGYVSMIDQNDIRGSKSIVNLSQFLYILQGFNIKKDFVNTIKIAKHRGYVPNTKLFNLMFNDNKKIYFSDVELEFEKFNELYQSQNRFRQSKKTKDDY